MPAGAPVIGGATTLGAADITSRFASYEITAAVDITLPDAQEDIDQMVYNAGTETGTFKTGGGTTVAVAKAGGWARLRTYNDSSDVPQWFTPPTYTFTNVTTDRTVDANASSTDELADALGTLIEDLRMQGLVL